MTVGVDTLILFLLNVKHISIIVYRFMDTLALLCQQMEENTLYINILKLLSILLITFIVSYITNKILGYFIRKSLIKKGTKSAIISAIKTPIITTIWIIGLSLGLDILSLSSGSSYFTKELSSNIRIIGVITIVTWGILRVIGIYENRLISGKYEVDIDKTTLSALINCAKIITYIVAALIMIQTLGFNINGILALGGATGIGISLAAKDLLSNFFGALMIYLDRPFKVGEIIKSPDKVIEGTVEQIGWRLTKIITPDQRPIYVPNSIFTTIIVENISRISNRRLREVLRIATTDIKSVKSAISDIEKYLNQAPEIDQSQQSIVYLENFVEKSADLVIETLINAMSFYEFQTFKQNLLLGVIEIINSHNINLVSNIYKFPHLQH